MQSAPPAPAAGRGALRVLAFCGGLALQIAGCTGSLFQSKAPPPAVYRLSAQLEPPAAAVVAADLAVQKPHARAGLGGARIAVLYPDRRLDYFAGARWSGPLDEVVQDLAVQAFRSSARLRNVSTAESAFASGYWLEIEIADFQAEYPVACCPAAAAAPTVNVHLMARIGGAGDRQVVGSFEVGARRTAADNRLSAIIDAYERAVDAALAELVADTVRTLN
jgi:cholesterol transport system auxiliary component